MLFINSENKIYSGNMREGDRELTDEEYQARENSMQKEIQLAGLVQQINDLDVKRIRAIAEPQLKDQESGQTWLEYYTEQIIAIRAQIADL